MAKLNYSDYPFFHKTTINSNTPQENDINNSEPKPVIEGIANFCALNRAHANQYHQGWNNLGKSINRNNQRMAVSDYANNMNRRLINQSERTDKYGTKYKYTCKNVKGTIRNRRNQFVSGGFVYAYSTDFNTSRGGVEVDRNGEFSRLNIKLVSRDEQYVFAYEDTTGRTWGLTVINGTSVVNCQSSAYNLQITEPKRFGGDNNDRDPNGKLKNTDLKNSGAELRYNAMKAVYDYTSMDTVNLGLGILVAAIFIIRSQQI